MATKKDQTKIKTITFKTYNEAMKNMFPNVWKEEQQEERKEKDKAEVMKELAGTVLSHF